MTLAIVHSRAISGLHAYPVTIEVHVSPGFPGLGMVGLPETTVKESRHRVRSAILNAGFDYPPRHIIVNLAPADRPKEGASFDLPIAIGILAATEQISLDVLSKYEFFGELALSGELKAVRGMLPLAIAAKQERRALMVPLVSVDEALLVDGVTVFAAASLEQVVFHLNGTKILEPIGMHNVQAQQPQYACLSDIKGQSFAKRALEIAAAGGHHMLMNGPPGSGKTMLANRLPGLLPPMPPEHCIETASLYSVSTLGFDKHNWGRRPFRSPHHTASQIALVGGSKIPKPGEVSLAHHGILFLDELPEFPRHVLEVLREPLESQEVYIARAAGSARFPAAFQLIAAMNPCPCGYYGDAEKACRCTPEQINRYQSRLSGPLLDRIDLHVQVDRVSTKELLQTSTAMAQTSEQVRERVMQAYAVQWQRIQKLNARLTAKEVQQYCVLGEAERELVESAIDGLNLSVRSVHRVLKVARTIADFDAQAQISVEHLSEALSFRMKD